MATGRIKFFDKEQGFGVIKPDKPGPDAYVLRSALEAARIFGIKPNQRVSISPSRTRYQYALLRAVSALSTGGASGARRVPLLSKRVTVKGGLSANRKDSCFGRSIRR